MNRLSRSNLQEFCRTCLSSLSLHEQHKLAANTPVENMELTLTTSYNINLLPQLRKLLVLFTSLDMNEDGADNDAYPRSLCQLCYDKMNDFQEFRNLAIHSAEVLYNIVNGMDDELVLSSSNALNPKNLEQSCKTIEYVDVKKLTAKDDFDDQLLLPELAPMRASAIKTEPIDIDETRLQSPVPEQQTAVKTEVKTNNTTRQQAAEASVKIEIDSEFEENYSTFYENNALGTSYNSVSDDADDEEHALRNGAANSSSATLDNSATGTKGRPRATVLSSKRDRNKKSLKCPRCDKQVYKQVYLDAHIRGVHEGHEKPFLCLECQKAFTRYNQLHLHVQSQHIIAQKFICGYNGCDAEFKLSNTLETHRKVVHTTISAPFTFGLEEVLELHQAQLNRELDMDHVCQQCFKKYSSKRALSEHLKRHAQIKEHVCKVCGVAKVTRTELQTHMRTHEPNLEKFKCTQCPQEFNHKNAISRHVRVVHEGQRRYPCSFCPKRFGTRNSQVCHERLHTGERPFNCESCSKTFIQLEGLKSHMKSHDKNLRTHVCTVCSQRFLTKRNLILHEQRHQSNKPHICVTCSRGFSLAETLTAHCRMHIECGELNAQPESDEEEIYNAARDGADFKHTNRRMISTVEVGDGSTMYGYSTSQSSN